jgi:hypothetical protein
MLKEDFWGPYFEDYRAYGLNIPKRLDMKRNMKQQEFITIEEINICETAWYQIIRLLRSEYMLYKVVANKVVNFSPMEIRVYINYEIQ